VIVGQPPCPVCGAPRCVLVRSLTTNAKREAGGQLGETCGKRTCAARLRAERLGPTHYRKIQDASVRARKAKPQQSKEYRNGYNAGLKTGQRSGYKAGYDAAVAERGQQS
jgi:hypothetical protein